MLPHSPPPGYFKEINSIISKFIWNDKCPRIKFTTLQHPNSAGGLAVPNFELYYWSFQLKALHNWVDPQSTVSWRVIEADKVKPNRLQDILFTGTGKKVDNYKFGPVVAYGVPWSSSIASHPMRDFIAPSAGRPSVSLIYNKMIDCITKPLSIKTIWNRELSDLNLSVDWERVWSNLSLTSKNLAHRLIHFKVIHRAYITPYKIFKMKLQSNLNCHIC